MGRRRSAREVRAAAKADIRAALGEFRASCRSRQARLLSLLRELAKEHTRDVDRLYAETNRLIEIADPEQIVPSAFDPADFFINWGPGEVEVPDRDSIGDIVPGGDVDDALDDLQVGFEEIEAAYADDDDD